MLGLARIIHYNSVINLEIGGCFVLYVLVVDSANRLLMEIRNPVVDARLPVIVLYILCLSTCWTRGGAQSCLTCIPSQCTVDESACPYGFTKDYCGCCDECLKGPGEKCGGFFGKCADGSRCYVKLDFGISYILYVQTPGICEGNNKVPIPLTLAFQFACTRLIDL